MTDGPPSPVPQGRTDLPMVPGASRFAEVARPVVSEQPVVAPKEVPVGVVVFDLDGTILDDLDAISRVAADVLARTFGTPADEGRVHYLATTGMPFEAQLAQLFPDAPAAVRADAARTFHARKVTEAYAQAHPFPEMPKLLKRLAKDGWTLAISTGAETEMAELMLEREGLRYWFDAVLGSRDGTKREHLAEYRRRFPGARLFLVGDSRFDMEAAASVPEVVSLARASSLPGWALTPADLAAWGAAWADYSLTDLPEALATLRKRRPATGPRRAKPPRRRRRA